MRRITKTALRRVAEIEQERIIIRRRLVLMLQYERVLRQALADEKKRWATR
mgnify:CR=1 FL=1